MIVPVKNGLEYTRALVHSVQEQNPADRIEWVIVDSGSTDGTLEFSEQIGARVVPFRSEPFNYCAALNAGAAQAQGDLWVMTNNDVEFRSAGALAALEKVFIEWPLLAVLSPGRESGEAEIEFRREWIYGPCWAVRPEAFRAWGGMPESVSGYGYDELWTILQCWHLGVALGYLTGWSVLHHGSVTFGRTGGNTTTAMRRNLSRLLATLGDSELDHGNDMHSVAEALCRRHLDRAPALLGVSEDWKAMLPEQGFANARVLELNSSPSLPRVAVQGASPRDRQWLPWLANELLLQPDADAVGGHGIYAVRTLSALNSLEKATSVGPPPPPVMPPLPPERASFRRRLGAYLHDWRHRKTRLPGEW